jgi:hypothetical protein
MVLSKNIVLDHIREETFFIDFFNFIPKLIPMKIGICFKIKKILHLIFY